MNIFLPKEITGLNFHLVYKDQKIQKITELPEFSDLNNLVFNSRDYLEILKLYHTSVGEIQKFPSNLHNKMMESLIKENTEIQIPWCYTMSPTQFREVLSKFCGDLERILSVLHLEYYWDHYKENNKTLSFLKKAYVDTVTLKNHQLDSKLSTPHILKTFKCNLTGFLLEITQYERTTRTGRLRVTSGPNILLLPHSQRNILTLSRFKEKGSVVYLDYSSLEPRTLLHINTIFFNQNMNINEEDDIYEFARRELNLTELSRKVIKDIILQQLYGAGYETILHLLSGIKDAQGIIDTINEQFGVYQLKDKLLKEYETNGKQFILNYYGRRINTADIQPYKLLNYFIQSTAVDVALYGFLNILKHIGNDHSGIIPLFVLHDGIILDVHEDYMDELTNSIINLGTEKIPLFKSCKFPLKLQKFN